MFCFRIHGLRGVRTLSETPPSSSQRASLELKALDHPCAKLVDRSGIVDCVRLEREMGPQAGFSLGDTLMSSFRSLLYFCVN